MTEQATLSPAEEKYANACRNLTPRQIKIVESIAPISEKTNPQLAYAQQCYRATLKTSKA